MKTKYVILLFVSFIIGLSIKSLLNTREIMKSTYNFVIDDIDTLDKGELVFYHENNKVSFSSFWVTKFDSILIGDSVAKDSCDRFLRFYRFDSDGGVELISSQESIMLFGRDLFCD